MARSRRKFPKFGQCCGSNTLARRFNRRAHRRICKVKVRQMDPEDHEAEDLPNATEVNLGDPWSWPTDGWHIWLDAPDKFMRK